MKRAVFIILAAVVCLQAGAQTASSLFWKKDGKQVTEIVSEQPVQYKYVGHHGPAVENGYFALRIYFNDSGAIDVYSKSGKQMELLRYGWYPSEEQQAAEGAGCDEYRVGSTIGAGGIALWDGEKEVKLAAKSRTARVGKTVDGSYAEIIAYGVEYKGSTVDISIRVDMADGSRFATITGSEINGKEVMFLTGVNYFEGGIADYGEGWIAAWGVHPPDVSKDPGPVGVGMRFNPADFSAPEKTGDMVRIISKPSSSIRTMVTCASVKEDEINTAEKLIAAVSSGHCASGHCSSERCASGCRRANSCCTNQTKNTLK